MSIFDIMEQHMTAAQDRWPDSFTFDGEVIACSLVSLTQAETIEVGEMFAEGYRAVLQVQKSRFPGDVPESEDLCIYEGDELRIKKIFKSSNNLALRLVLGGKYA